MEPIKPPWADMADIHRRFFLLAMDGYLSILQSLYSQHHQSIDINWRSPHYLGATALIIASWSGHTSVVQWLLNFTNAEVDAADDEQCTALHYACQFGYNDIVVALLDHHAFVGVPKEVFEAGNSALHWAASCGHEQVVTTLLDKSKADVNAPNGDGETAIQLAVLLNNESTVRKLVEYGANLHVQTDCGITPLMQVVKFGFGKIAEHLLENGAAHSINTVDKDGDTALIHAAERGDYKVAKLLIDHGADIHIKNNCERTALTVAALFGNDKVVRLLIDSGANVRERTSVGHTPLVWASMAPKGNVIMELLQTDARDDVNVACYNGDTPLFFVGLEDQPQLVRILLDYGSDPSIPANASIADKIGTNSALMVLESYSPIAGTVENLYSRLPSQEREVFEELWYRAGGRHGKARPGKGAVREWLEKTAGMSGSVIEEMFSIFKVCERNNVSIATFAAMMRYFAILEMNGTLEMDHVMNVQKRLVPHHPNLHVDLTYTKEFFRYARYGKLQQLQDLYDRHRADINVEWRNPNAGGATALIQAAQEGHEDLASWLVEVAGARLDARTDVRDTVLTLAISKDNLAVVRKLLTLGANPNEPNSLGDTPLLRASKVGNDKIVQELLDYGAEIHCEDDAGNTPLTIASENSRFEIAEVLVRGGADVLHLRSIMIDACSDLIDAEKVVECVTQLETNSSRVLDVLHTKMFVAYGLDGQLAQMRELYHLYRDSIDVNGLDPTTGTPALIEAVASCSFPVVTWLLQDVKVIVDQKGRNGETALIEGMLWGDQKIVHALLQHGANIEQESSYGKPVLWEAVSYEGMRVVQMVIDHGANVEATDAEGNAAIHWAVQCRKSEIIPLLAKNGADVNAINGSGETAILIAASHGHHDVIWSLLDVGADIQGRTLKGYSVLHLVAQAGLGDIVEELLRRGANAFSSSPEGMPLLVSYLCDELDSVQFLLEHESNTTPFEFFIL